MANPIFYRQCMMHEYSSENTVVYTAWIPEKFAVQGKIISIDQDDKSKMSYEVKEVYEPRLTAESIHEIHGIHKILPSIEAR